MTRFVCTNIAQVVTCTSSDLSSVRTSAVVAVEDGVIAAIGDRSELDATFAAAERIDCRGGVLTPGFVDSHTHALFGRYRAGEYALRSQGVPYMEIAKRGGGINASVGDVRARSQEELETLARPRLHAMLALGTTTAEVKSGYGLETAAELKMLRAITTLVREGPIDIEPTFLGAHEFPPEFREDRETYVNVIVSEMIPAVAEQGVARFCDVFMEPGVFTAAQSRRILEAGLDYGLVPRLHADELEGSGGAELAAEIGAASADHLGAISEAGIAALAASDTVAGLLPATLFFLGRKNYAPARGLLDAGATIALATDFNPGSAPSPSMPLVLTIACSQMGLSPLEAIRAATAGGARVLRLKDGRGTLRPGAPADLILWDVEHFDEIPYHFGMPRIARVWKRGRAVV